jgi:hypothetical protein
MHRIFCFISLGLLAGSLGADERAPSKPLYKVTVVQRSIRAINYGHRELPTAIDFKGTIIYPEAKGQATVRAKAGVVQVDLNLQNLGAPSRFGPQYLTYVLWAITPEGQTQRLGEIITNHKDKSKLRVTTSLQTFGLIVTAEPYFAVSRPSPVIVLENMMRPDTVGKVEEVDAKYELLPAAQEYTFDVDAARRSDAATGPLVSMKEYEALLAIYEARNAIQIAKADEVEAIAGETLRKAEELLRQAEQITDRNKESKRIVMLARQASQTAHDARSIAQIRSERLAKQP